MENSQSAAEAWHRRADELPRWTAERLVNRRDCFGYYAVIRREVKPNTFKLRIGQQLSDIRILRHLTAENTGHVLGLHTTRYFPDGVCRSKWGATDLDFHDDHDDSAANLRAALDWHERLTTLGFHALLVDSNGRGGYRNMVIFDGPVVTSKVYHFFRWLVGDWQELGLPVRPETFPKQPEISPPGSDHGSFGNWLRIPGRHHKRDHWTRIWRDGQWIEGNQAIDAILATTGDLSCLIPAEALVISDRPAPRKIALAATRHPPTTGESGERSEPESLSYVPGQAYQIKRARPALRYLGPGARDTSGHEYISDYEVCLVICMSLYELGSAGLDLWIKWSKQCPQKFSPASCREKWGTFGHGNCTLGTIFYHARRLGWPDSTK